MLANTYYQVLASTYGSGTYDSSTYNGATTTTGGNTGTGSTGGTTTTTGGAASGSNGGSLVDTGVVVFAFVGIAAAIILAALVIRIWKRKPADSPKQ